MPSYKFFATALLGAFVDAAEPSNWDSCFYESPYFGSRNRGVQTYSGFGNEEYDTAITYDGVSIQDFKVCTTSTNAISGIQATLNNGVVGPLIGTEGAGCEVASLPEGSWWHSVVIAFPSTRGIRNLTVNYAPYGSTETTSVSFGANVLSSWRKATLPFSEEEMPVLIRGMRATDQSLAAISFAKVHDYCERTINWETTVSEATTFQSYDNGLPTGEWTSVYTPEESNGVTNAIILMVVLGILAIIFLILISCDDKKIKQERQSERDDQEAKAAAARGETDRPMMN